jgi:hypothetical protein
MEPDMTDPVSFPCAVCDRPSLPRVHDGCRQHIADDLAELPGLYRQLEQELAPGRRGDGGRSGSRSAPIPVSLDVLDLRARGGIEGVVGGWARDVCEREGWTIPLLGSVEAIVDWACSLLLVNLPMLCDEHPAIREIADEIRQVTGQARRLVSGEPAPRRIPVACPCGAVLRVTLDTPGAKCPGCETQYGHDEVLGLPMAERRAAA